MRLTNVFGGRPASYDRNPTTIVNGGSQYSQAPHALTTRWTYTVPTARKFILGFWSVMALRVSVAGTAGAYEPIISATPSGGSNKVLVDLEQLTNLAGDNARLTGGGGTTYLAGDALLGQDFDGSTNGTVSFNESMSGTEFDA